jgi:uncharacterized linocin/CFP29 family protein
MADTDRNVVDLNWTDDQWNTVLKAVSDEAQRARVAASFLPLCGPLDASTIAVPNFTLSSVANAYPGGAPPANRLQVNSSPTLELLRISAPVYLRSHEAADPDLTAAIGMFRRAANLIARVEDSVVFLGDHAGRTQPRPPLDTLVTLSAHALPVQGLLPAVLPPAGGAAPLAPPPAAPAPAPQPPAPVVLPNPKVPGSRTVFVQYHRTLPNDLGQLMVVGIVSAIADLEAKGHFGPFACVLGTRLYEAVCTPTSSLVLPKDRILPFVDGQLFRSGTIEDDPATGTFYGVVVALGGAPIELVVASDISVRLLQATLEPRWVFRVSERIALRIKEPEAIAVLCAHP